MGCDKTRRTRVAIPPQRLHGSRPKDRPQPAVAELPGVSTAKDQVREAAPRVCQLRPPGGRVCVRDRSRPPGEGGREEAQGVGRPTPTHPPRPPPRPPPRCARRTRHTRSPRFSRNVPRHGSGGCCRALDHPAPAGPWLPVGRARHRLRLRLRHQLRLWPVDPELVAEFFPARGHGLRDRCFAESEGFSTAIGLPV